MLSEVFNDLAANVMPDVFNEAGFELVRIVRPTRSTNAYGGDAESTSTESDDIPAMIEYTASSRFVPVTAGQEYIEAVIQMPLVYGGSAVDVTQSDRIKVLERGVNPERLFQVKRVKPSPIHLVIDVVTATA